MQPASRKRPSSAFHDAQPPAKIRVASTMAQGDAVSSVPIPWAQLRAWIDAQEAVEQRENRPAPLPRHQLAALSHFVEFIGEEPDVSDNDYVSSLMHIAQVRGLRLPVFKDLDPVEVPSGGAFVMRWRTLCILSRSDVVMVVPSVGYGIEEGEEAPMFKSKKMAKQYAAKQALLYLLNERSRSRPTPGDSGRSSHSPGGASLISTFSPVAKTSLPSGSNDSARPSSLLPSPAIGGDPARPSPNPTATTTSGAGDKPTKAATRPKIPSSTTSADQAAMFPEKAEKSNSDFDSDDGPSVLSRVATVATRLGLESPSYQIEPDGERPNFFSARPLFKNACLHVPSDVGVVTGVYGKKQAKRLSAEALLAWLEAESARREELTRGLLEGL